MANSPPHQRPDSLNLSPLTLVLIGALVGALAWGTCSNSRASDATKALEAALHARDDSAAAWQVARIGLQHQLSTLQADSGRLAASYALARSQARLGRDSITALLNRLPDSTRNQLAPAIQTLTNEGLACRETLGNCELRAANAESRAHGDSMQLVQTILLLQQTEVAWRTAQRDNSPGFLGLRSFWKARSYTLPLTALSVLLILTHR